MSKKDDKNAKRDREALLADSPSYDRFEALTEKLLKVPKEEVDEKRAEKGREKRVE